VDSVIATQLVGGTLHRSGAVTSGIPVHIQSYGRVRDASVETGGDYDIQSTYDYYRRLLSIQGPVAAVPVAGTMRITGYAWQQGGSTLWKNFVTWDVNPDSLNTTVTVPTPAVGPIITGHSGAPDPPSSGFPNVTYTLDAGGSTPKFFYTNSGFELSLNTALNTTIKVSGPVVWCFPRGVALQGVVKVEPFGSQPNTSLTIIAGHTLFPGYVGYGIWFNNGVDSPLVPLVLVSDGSTRLIQQYEIFNKSIPYLSVFSKSLLLEGPPVFGTTWHLTHTPGSPHDQPGGLIDILATAGALPNATVSGAKYTLRKGTWQTAAN
jgi:hypothetical protein